MASLLNSPDAFKLYDVAVKYASFPLFLQRASSLVNRLAVNNDWLLEEGWGLFLVRHIFMNVYSGSYAILNLSKGHILCAVA